jgi:hypothetical protein
MVFAFISGVQFVFFVQQLSIHQPASGNEVGEHYDQANDQQQDMSESLYRGTRHQNEQTQDEQNYRNRG